MGLPFFDCEGGFDVLIETFVPPVVLEGLPDAGCLPFEGVDGAAGSRMASTVAELV